MSIELSGIRTVCVQMFGGIGDYLMVTPMLNALRERAAGAKVIMLVRNPAVLQVAVDDGMADETIHVDKISLFALIRKLRSERIDVAITAAGVDPFKASLFAWAVGARYRIGESRLGGGFFYNFPTCLDPEQHQVEASLSLLRPLGIQQVGVSFGFRISKKERMSADHMLREKGVSPEDLVVGFHPGAGPDMPFKRWLPERFSRVADVVQRHWGGKALFFGGLEERGLCSEICDQMGSGKINLAGQLTLKQAGAMIERCKAMVCNDAGLMHIAGAVGTPIVAVFGPTRYRRTGPYGLPHRIVRTGLPCSPCFPQFPRRAFRCDIGVECLHGISSERMVEALRELLQAVYLDLPSIS